MADPLYLMMEILILLTGCCSGVMAGYHLVMDEQFDSLDTTNRWDYEITCSGGGNMEFEMYTDEPNNTFVRDGKLFIKPTLSADKFGESWLTNGVLDIKALYGRCTQDWDNGCTRRGKDGTINPIMSGTLRSRVYIRYGKVEVIAKLPRGDWMWPAIWLLPVSEEYGYWPASGDIDIAEARGNRNYSGLGISSIRSSLHWGPDEYQNRVNMTRRHYTSPSGTWADGMHNYTLEWDSTGIRVHVDDHLVLNASTPPYGYWAKGGFSGENIWYGEGQDAPFDKLFYLILSVAVGGTNGFFPDDVPNGGYPKPWSNSARDAAGEFWAAKDLWYPTWQGDDAAMQVESVRMWQLTDVTTTAQPSSTIVTEVPKEEDSTWRILLGCLVGLVGLIVIMLLILIIMWRCRILWMMKIKYHFQSSEQNDGRTFDAFVSYCGRNDDFSQSQDERFVIYKLRQKLEHELGYSLCIHQRDFVPGEAITDNIMSAVDNSRRTILVLSQRYVRSEWCKAEYKVAHCEMLKRQHRIIPIMMERPADIPVDDPVLEYILNNITYIKYPGEEDEKRLERFWKRIQYSMPKVRVQCRTLTFQLSVISTVEEGGNVVNEVGSSKV